MDRSFLSRKESGKSLVNRGEQRAFAKAFGLSLEAFDDLWRTAMLPRRSVVGRGIPVINRGPAGTVMPLEEWGTDSGHGYEFLDWGDINDDLVFAVAISGNSMEPSLFDGDYLILGPLVMPRPRYELKDGDVVFVRFTPESGREGCMVARYHRQADGRIVLTKDNRNHKPVVCKPEDIEQLAVAIEKRSKKI